jgi:Ca-activated chloride channel family protein
MIVKYPIVLLLLIPIVVAIFVYRNIKTMHTIRFPKAAWLTALTSTKATRLLKIHRFLQVAILLLMVVTIAQPQWRQSEKYQTKKGIDIITLLDTSGSMNAEDFKPKNRMEVAKETLEKFVKKRGNDRMGMVIFGDDAITKSPLTFDHRILRNRINQTTVGEAGDATAIGLAIATGLNRLERSSATSKIMILITDGVNNAGQIDPISAAKLAKKKNIKIYTIGIGDKKGAPIPIYHPTYGKRFARYPNGQLVLTQLDEKTLKDIAFVSGGKYFNAINTEQLKTIYDEIDELEKTVINTSKSYVTFDIFPYLIALIIVMILLKETIALTALVGVKT